jgi:hypothetical protein
MLSAGDNTFKYDLRSEDGEGRQDSALSVWWGRQPLYHPSGHWPQRSSTEKTVEVAGRRERQPSFDRASERLLSLRPVRTQKRSQSTKYRSSARAARNADSIQAAQEVSSDNST